MAADSDKKRLREINARIATLREGMARKKEESRR